MANAFEVLRGSKAFTWCGGGGRPARRQVRAAAAHRARPLRRPGAHSTRASGRCPGGAPHSHSDCIRYPSAARACCRGAVLAERAPLRGRWPPPPPGGGGAGAWGGGGGRWRGRAAPANANRFASFKPTWQATDRDLGPSGVMAMSAARRTGRESQAFPAGAWQGGASRRGGKGFQAPPAAGAVGAGT
jgi:hypothetical protein